MTSPAVSIIMNCRNCGKDLPGALLSVVNQTFGDWEIIFWDNCSTDNSAEIAQNFGPKLRYFSATYPTSLGKARNLAIREARGKYIAFLDCDDMWKPDKLKSQVALFEKNPALGLVCTDSEISDGARTISTIFRRSPPRRGHVYGELIKNQWIVMSSAMISARALASLDGKGDWFDENLELCEEADVFYRIAHDWELDFIDQPLAVWRVHGRNSTFRNFDRFAMETEYILEKHRKLFPDIDERHPEIVAAFSLRATFQKAVSLWKNGNAKAARSLIAPHLRNSKKFRLFWMASFLPGKSFDILAKLYFTRPGRY